MTTCIELDYVVQILNTPPPPKQALTTCTELKYAVEILIPRSTRLLGVMEPILERCVFEDMPANLWAIKRRVEWTQVGLQGAGIRCWHVGQGVVGTIKALQHGGPA